MSCALCPSHQELSDYALGRLDGASGEAVEAHVEACPHCQTSLRDIDVGSDPLVQGLRHGSAGEPSDEGRYEREAACHVAVAQVAAMWRREAPTVADLSATGWIRDYQLLERIGHGGMGTVYKALHTRLGKLVAVKVLSPRFLRDPQAIARFQREMRSVGALEHPHIVRALDAGECEGTPYLVMEYVPGIDLSVLARLIGPLPVAEACELVRQAALGLESAHRQGLIHRDIKPSNLILSAASAHEPGRAAPPEAVEPRDGSGARPAASSPSGECVVKVLDLGLARLEEARDEDRELTAVGQLMGTVDYMSPEQGADTRQVDGRTDIYSLGATLYRLLCGHAPFAGPQYAHDFQKLAALISEPAPPLRTQRADLPDELAAVVDRMLARDPRQRFATPGDVARALAPFARGCDLPALARAAVARLRPDPTDHPSAGAPAAREETRVGTLDLTAERRLAADRRIRRTRAAVVLPVVVVLAVAALWYRTGVGQLVLRVDEPDTRITIDGERQEVVHRSPDDGIVLTIPTGRHELAVSKPGFQPQNVTFHVARNARVELTLRLQSLPAGERPADAARNAAAADSDRAMGKWILARGGSFDLHPHGAITRQDDLPDGPFRIRNVNLWQRGLVDADLERFTTMPKLEGVSVQANPRLTDAAVRHVVRIRTLRWLYIGRNRMTAEGVAALVVLTRLNSLSLSGLPVSDTVLGRLTDLRLLRELILEDTPITDEGLRHLARFPDLLRLDLSATAVTDAGLARLAQSAPGLKYLLLQRTQVTDPGLEHLEALRHLRELHLKGARVTSEGVESLRSALPDCRISF